MARDNRMLALMRDRGITLPGNAMEWRTTVDRVGELRPLFECVTLLCTDGVVGWFEVGDSGSLFFGHLSNFVEEKAEGRETAGIRPTKSVSAKQKARQVALTMED